jgi:hypothetical protein
VSISGLGAVFGPTAHGSGRSLKEERGALVAAPVAWRNGVVQRSAVMQGSKAMLRDAAWVRWSAGRVLQAGEREVGR